MYRWIYQILLYLALPWVVLRALKKAFKAKTLSRFGERFGFFSNTVIKGSVVVHAVSVGESLAALLLIDGLRKEFPSLDITLTCTTETASEIIKNRTPSQVQHFFLPYDYQWSIRKFLRKLKPSVLIIMETELWPNLIHECHRLNVPICLVNARLSERSASKYARWHQAVTPMLQQLTMVLVQSEPERQRFINLGIHQDRITTTGSIKWDIQITDKMKEQAQIIKCQMGLINTPVWIAASTHPGEEASVLEAQRFVKQTFPQAKLIWAPRHPDRGHCIEDLCAKQGLKTQSLSTMPNGFTTGHCVYIIDVLGQLLPYFMVSDMAFVGGSLISHGGHNLIEPAAMGTPIITGPYGFNFADLNEQLKKAKGLLEVSDAQTLATQLIRLFQCPLEAEKLVSNAQNVIEKNLGALNNTTEKLKSCLTKV